MGSCFVRTQNIKKNNILHGIFYLCAIFILFYFREINEDYKSFFRTCCRFLYKTESTALYTSGDIPVSGRCKILLFVLLDLDCSQTTNTFPTRQSDTCWRIRMRCIMTAPWEKKKREGKYDLAASNLANANDPTMPNVHNKRSARADISPISMFCLSKRVSKYILDFQFYHFPEGENDVTSMTWNGVDPT